uniref:Uncharacterized protein n=1 Tax=Rhizophora mucronata TaxID=61149 RepID=A0A2P2QP17_RHIMU
MQAYLPNKISFSEFSNFL